VHPASGAGGVVVLLLLAVSIALGFGAVGLFMALRTGSGESVQGLFPVLFVFLLVSSMNFPRNLIEADWFRWLATLNPVSYLIEGVRSLIIEGWNGEAIGLAFAISAALLAVALAASALALRERMTRT
jgi:ABC-2 type transport system permease protein